MPDLGGNINERISGDGYQGLLLRQFDGFYTNMMVSVLASGRKAGLPYPIAAGVQVMAALSAIALGFAVFREARPRLWIAAGIVGFFAIFHGHAHGTELPPGANGVLYSIGFVIATGTLHALGIAIGLVHRWTAGRIALRAAGALVAIAGLFFLWNAVNGGRA